MFERLNEPFLIDGKLKITFKTESMIGDISYMLKSLLINQTECPHCISRAFHDIIESMNAERRNASNMVKDAQSKSNGQKSSPSLAKTDDEVGTVADLLHNASGVCDTIDKLLIEFDGINCDILTELKSISNNKHLKSSSNTTFNGGQKRLHYLQYHIWLPELTKHLKDLAETKGKRHTAIYERWKKTVSNLEWILFLFKQVTYLGYMNHEQKKENTNALVNYARAVCYLLSVALRERWGSIPFNRYVHGLTVHFPQDFEKHLTRDANCERGESSFAINKRVALYQSDRSRGNAMKRMMINHATRANRIMHNNDKEQNASSRFTRILGAHKPENFKIYKTMLSGVYLNQKQDAWDFFFTFYKDSVIKYCVTQDGDVISFNFDNQWNFAKLDPLGFNVPDDLPTVDHNDSDDCGVRCKCGAIAAKTCTTEINSPKCKKCCLMYRYYEMSDEDLPKCKTTGHNISRLDFIENYDQGEVKSKIAPVSKKRKKKASDQEKMEVVKKGPITNKNNKKSTKRKLEEPINSPSKRQKSKSPRKKKQNFETSDTDDADGSDLEILEKEVQTKKKRKINEDETMTEALNEINCTSEEDYVSKIRDQNKNRRKANLLNEPFILSKFASADLLAYKTTEIQCAYKLLFSNYDENVKLKFLNNTSVKDEMIILREEVMELISNQKYYSVSYYIEGYMISIIFLLNKSDRCIHCIYFDPYVNCTSIYNEMIETWPSKKFKFHRIIDDASPICDIVLNKGALYTYNITDKNMSIDEIGKIPNLRKSCSVVNIAIIKIITSNIEWCDLEMEGIQGIATMEFGDSALSLINEIVCTLNSNVSSIHSVGLILPTKDEYKSLSTHFVQGSKKNLVEKEKIILHELDFYNLKSGQRLCTEIINFCINLFLKDATNKSFKVIGSTSAWIYYYMMSSGQYDFKKVIKIIGSKKNWIPIDNIEYLVFPININNMHWSLVNVDTVSEKLHYMDSISGFADHNEICTNVKKFIYDYTDGRKDATNWSVSKVTVPQQTGSIDCGLYMLYFIRCLSIGKGTFNINQNDITLLRRAIAFMIYKLFDST
ncbi:MAG: hypothetical protein H0U27_00670 [Nitrosopumilus sp.]|nr:hypothetical protein [Nitrosopumilus sp.]